jgi:hypothetical protein
MFAYLLVPAAMLTGFTVKADSTADADRTAIKQAALDYIEGWTKETLSGWREACIPSWPSESSAPIRRLGKAGSIR